MIKYLNKTPFLLLVFKLLFVTVEKIASDFSNLAYLSSKIMDFEGKVYYTFFCK